MIGGGEYTELPILKDKRGTLANITEIWVADGEIVLIKALEAVHQNEGDSAFAIVRAGYAKLTGVSIDGAPKFGIGVPFQLTLKSRKTFPITPGNLVFASEPPT